MKQLAKILRRQMYFNLPIVVRYSDRSELELPAKDFKSTNKNGLPLTTGKTPENRFLIINN